MRTKLSQLRDAAASNDWLEALRIAAKFDRLGAHRCAILRGHQAKWHPEWSRQVGRDPATDIAVGIEALRERYRLD